jgi:hypothetical protein
VNILHGLGSSSDTFNTVMTPSGDPTTISGPW